MTVTADIAQLAGRVTPGDRHAHVSPLANPQAFALRNGLTIVNEVREQTTGGFNSMVVFRDENGFALVSGTVTDSRDDSAIIDYSDLDFVSAGMIVELMRAASDTCFTTPSARFRKAALFVA